MLLVVLDGLIRCIGVGLVVAYSCVIFWSHYVLLQVGLSVWRALTLFWVGFRLLVVSL